ncbi:MAG: hypothetical protein KJ905_02585 [Nanoarchaeota archaeon]|nr:hypothetical protein [Nanoarchaeota archaeon]
MKRVLIFLFLIIILAASSVSAVELQFTKDSPNFNQGETLISVASGNFIDQITSNNILFYQDHVRIPMDFEVSKIGDDFYIYALLSNKPEGNYSMRINDVSYTKVLEIVDDELIQNFTISNATVDFYVTPGFVKTSEDFYLDVQNIQDASITINVDSSLASSSNSVSLSSGELKRINFDLDSNTNETIGRVNLSSGNTAYSVPLFVEKKSSSSEVQGLAFRIEPRIVNVSLATNSSTERILYLINYGSEGAKNITFSIPPALNPYITISPRTISNFEKDDTEKITISIISGTSASSIQGTIKAVSNNGFETTLDIFLEFIPGYVPPEGTTDESSSNTEILTTCAQLEGTLCDSDKVCSIDTIQTGDKEKKLCCPRSGVCETPESSGSTGTIIGWSIILVVIVLLFWFFNKYKKVRPKVDVLKIGRGQK